MVIALLAAAVPVLIGVGLALSPGLLGPGPMRVARWIAIVAALGVVLIELLPHAWEAAGWLAAPLFALGLAVPVIVGRVVRARDDGHSLIGEELAFVAIGAHQVVDGLEIGAAWQVASGAWALTLAIAAHSIPLLAAVLLELGRHRGRRDTLVRGAVLVALTAGGAALGWSGGSLPGAESWLPALLAGLFVHVLWHLRHDDHEHHDG